VSRVRRLTVDTSVAVKWFFDEPRSDRAEHLRELLQAGALAPVGPDLIYPEFANVVWKRVRFRRLPPAEGEAILATFAAIPFEIVPSLPLISAAYRLGVEVRQPIYDTLFLALSLALDTDLVTDDEPFFRAVHTKFPRVRWLGSWPS
jgi:predicted nucleic acid-binding protein